MTTNFALSFRMCGRGIGCQIRPGHRKTTNSRITLDLQAPVARITLHNPPVNVIDIPMMDELTAALATIDRTSGDFGGHSRRLTKGVFRGVDVAPHAGQSPRDAREFHGVIHALINSRKVTIACARKLPRRRRGTAAGCDLVYTSESATWGFPEIKLGCYPPVAATVLSAIVGQKRAADLILTGRSITGREAAAIGLANEAAPTPRSSWQLNGRSTS